MRAGRAKDQSEDPAGARIAVPEVVDGTTMATSFVSSPAWQNAETAPAGGENKPRDGAQGKRGTGLAGRRVLIVEDEAMISALIEMIIGEAGYSAVGPVATLERAFRSSSTNGSMPLCST